MTAVSQAIDSLGKGLLAALVAIVLLVGPLANAAQMACEEQTAQITLSGKAHDAHRSGDDCGGHQKNCCSSLCTWCNLILPSPDLVARPIARDGERLFAAQPTIHGLVTPPALGPPRPLV